MVVTAWMHGLVVLQPGPGLAPVRTLSRRDPGPPVTSLAAAAKVKGSGPTMTMRRVRMQGNPASIRCEILQKILRNNINNKLPC